ncbi:3-methyl-2-oxobutanoate hydroxymethyltransferase [Kocuria massiliensis]|uniref:3-methyl-2-oxobutanoate hydroxymethyltransferase n=1 Tax=Kocuria massiliensis TaxID=1926282 RepID=UPI001FE88705|nr:3-methyl-2-oxobutanoate hydroxymethyltransferase [Kocuria massiliensis]
MASYLQDRDDQTPHADDWLSAVRRVRTTHLQRCKDLGHRFSMLTSYDALTAEIFDAAGIEVLLIGDSAGNTVFGYESTLPVTLDELIPLTRAVSRAAQRALVIVDLPFGTYEESPAQAVASAVLLMKEGEAHAVKMEGGAYYAEHVRAMVQAGIPVMAHVGFTPQSTNALGGFRVQGRAEAASRLIEDATALEAAGAFAVLAEMSAEDAVRAMDEALTVPTVGIGAGRSTTGQVLVWQDMAGLTTGKTPRFVKKYADVRSVITDAASSYRKDVLDGSFPAEAHVFRE